MSLWAIGLAGVVEAEVWSAPKAYEAVKRGDLILVDIRGSSDWRKTGLPEGAWPIHYLHPDFMRTLTDTIIANRGKRVGLIGYDGKATGYLEKKLIEHGYPEIVNVSEGMNGSKEGIGWLEHGLPVVSWAKALRAMPADHVLK